ncbi:MAG TPA: DUF2382 domain-containing protein [Candidatus Polarisedimenticolia bacterium]|nr:DUF2382 domain-containing protein [Candidatus Polarisedimenticolia bacterium]
MVEDSGQAEAAQTVPLLEERLAVERRVVETGRVRVRLSTATKDAMVRETLRGERVEVDRVPVGREVTEAPVVREEENGTVLVVPVLEEVLVVERRLVLKEELRIRRVSTTEIIEQTVALRQQAATVERLLTAVPQDGSDPETRRRDVGDDGDDR